MVDIETFLDSVSWIRLLQRSSIAADGAIGNDIKYGDNKRARRDPVFKGKSCIIVGGAILHVNFGADPFALNTIVTIENNSLLIEWEDEQSKIILCQIDHGAIVFLRRSRANRRSQLPPSISLDFGLIQIRLWHEDASFFALETFSQFNELLSISSSGGADSDATHLSQNANSVLEGDAVEIMEELKAAVDVADAAVRTSDQRTFYHGINEILKICNAVRHRS